MDPIPINRPLPPGPCIATALLLALSCLFCVLVSPSAQAAIYSCRTEQGGTVFQDRPCELVQAPGMDAALQDTRPPPLGMHASWLSPPEEEEERAVCDRERCRCRQQVREHTGSLPQAVADALYLDGAWHRYRSALSARQTDPVAATRGEHGQSEVQEAACSLMMSQRLLQDFGREVEQQLRQQARLAEARGFDQAAPCEADMAGACRAWQLTRLYARLLEDARALQRPRDDFFGNTGLPANR